MKCKKILVLSLSLCVFALSAGFISCSSDDDDSPSSSETLAGVYKHTEADAIVEVTNEEIKDEVIDVVKSFTSANDDVFVFKRNGSYESKASAESEIVEGTYEFDGVQVVLSEGKRSFTYENYTIQSEVDVKSIVAERLGIDVTEIKKAIRVDVYADITK